MVLSPFVDYIPATDSTSFEINLPVSGSSSLGYWISNIQLTCNDWVSQAIADELWKREQKRLRYSPFRIVPKSFYKSSPVMKRPRLLQIMPKPVRIGRHE